MEKSEFYSKHMFIGEMKICLLNKTKLFLFDFSADT